MGKPGTVALPDMLTLLCPRLSFDVSKFLFALVLSDISKEKQTSACPLPPLTLILKMIERFCFRPFALEYCLFFPPMETVIVSTSR